MSSVTQGLDVWPSTIPDGKPLARSLKNIKFGPANEKKITFRGRNSLCDKKFTLDADVVCSSVEGYDNLHICWGNSCILRF